MSQIKTYNEIRQNYVEQEYDLGIINENINKIKLGAKKMIEENPNFSVFLEHTVNNGRPVMMGSCDDGVYILRTFGLSFLGKYEFCILFPESYMNEANGIAQDLVMATLHNENKVRPNRKVHAARFGLLYKTKLSDMLFASQSWQQFLNVYDFEGIEIIFNGCIEDILSCATCQNHIENQDEAIKCNICNNMYYCNSDCKDKDHKHLEFCESIKNIQCVLCDSVSDNNCGNNCKCKNK